jgi:hypothetical protein
MTLRPCSACARHIQATESACPFCGAAVSEAFAQSNRTPAGVTAPLTRAALLFMGATAATACSSSSSSAPGPLPAYGPAPIEDASSDHSGPVALYGPAPVQDAAVDHGGPVALYGPAVIDSGEEDAG